MAKYRECADAGMTQAEAARALGVSRRAVSKFAMRHDIPFRQYVIKGPARTLNEQIRRSEDIISDLETISDEARRIYGNLRHKWGFSHRRAMEVLS